MSEAIYKTKIVQVGVSALTFLPEKMLIFFNKRAQEDLAEYSVLIDDGEGRCNVVAGDYLILGSTKYCITAVGDVAVKNFDILGHAVVKFDGNRNADLPGSIHVEDKDIVEIVPNLSVSFSKK